MRGFLPFICLEHVLRIDGRARNELLWSLGPEPRPGVALSCTQGK